MPTDGPRIPDDARGLGQIKTDGDRNTENVRTAPKVADMGGRPGKPGRTDRAERTGNRDHVTVGADGHDGTRRRPAIMRKDGGDKAHGTRDMEFASGYHGPYHHYARDIHLGRYYWLHDLHRRHAYRRSFFGLSIYAGSYAVEPYWRGYRPYIGRWHGYSGWYRCTPYTTGIWYPWHRRSLVGYVYSPWRRDIPYSTTVWVNYDPFIYSWWPAPYSVSVNYFTTETGDYPGKTGSTGTYTDWAQYEPSTAPAYVEPEYVEEYEPPETWAVDVPPVQPVQPAEKTHDSPLEVVDMDSPTPAGTVEAATLPEKQSVETDRNVPTMPLDTQSPASVSAAQPAEAKESRPVEPAISVPAPGGGNVQRTAMAAGGLAFLGAALWMAWPKT